MKEFPAFENPPVDEVVCGIVFEAIKEFRAHHLGLFWEKVSEHFPYCEQTTRLDFAPNTEIDLKNYLPRIWCLSAEKDRLIQLQENCLFFNWRRVEEGEPYPHYSTIRKDYNETLEIFQDFLKERNLDTFKPALCELTYVNHISKGKGWESLSDINMVFPDLVWRSEGERFLPKPQLFSGQASFLLPDDKGDLNLTLQLVERKSDKVHTLKLTNSARGLGVDKSMEGVWKWFDVAHEWIVRGFADLTGPKIQKDVWKRRDIT